MNSQNGNMPHIFVLSAPSGGGKNTVIKRLIDRDSDIQYVISATTRLPRRDEMNGCNYHFLSEAEFQDKIKADDFLEWAHVYGSYYGTLRSEVNKVFDAGKNVVMDVDIQGALALKEKVVSNGILIFLLPPSLRVLEKRLKERGTDSSEEIAKRLQKARKEIEFADQYDFQIINEDLDKTVNELLAIVQAFKALKKEELVV